MLQWLKSLLPTPGRSRATLGQRGENVAAKYLRSQGYTIILRNFRCRLGEIDIIARDGKSIVFVEVKTRANDEMASLEDRVDEAKQKQLTSVAKFYLGRYGVPQPPARFDVVAIVWPPGRDPIVQHIPFAFEPTF